MSAICAVSVKKQFVNDQQPQVSATRAGISRNARMDSLQPHTEP